MGRKERRTRSTLRPATGIESVPTADRPTANRRSCTEWLGFRALCRCPIGPRGRRCQRGGRVRSRRAAGRYKPGGKVACMWPTFVSAALLLLHTGYVG